MLLKNSMVQWMYVKCQWYFEALKTCLPNTPSPTMRISSLTSPRSVPFLLIVKYLPVVMLFNLTRLVPKDCISNNTKIWQTKKELIHIPNSTYPFTLILAGISPPLNERSTSKLWSETRRELEQKCVPARNCFWDCYWGRASQLLANFPLSLVTVPDVFANFNSPQFPLRGKSPISLSCIGAARKVSPDWSQKTMTYHSFNCFSIVWGQG